MTAYYNEFDPKAAAWLRELITQGHIANGVVDERSIEDVTPNDLKGFTQCHFFAGIGVWSYALRRAGWADNRPVWTGSCPCQPFSTAGARGGFDDQRHLWPHWHHLISQCRPPVVFGEQVASKDGLGWLDLVHADMEATGYAFGAADLCAAGVGAPHIRQRLWWVGTRLADANNAKRWSDTAGGDVGDGHHAGRQEGAGHVEGRGSDGGLADAMRIGQSGQGVMGRPSDSATEGDWQEHRIVNAGGCRVLGNAPGAGLEGAAGAGLQGAIERPSHAGDHGGVADASGQHLRGELGGGDGETGAAKGEARQRERRGNDHSSSSAVVGLADTAGRGQLDALNGSQRGQGVEQIKLAGGSISVQLQRPSPTNGFWGSADWLFCRDGKWRPVEPSTFPLAHGAAERVGRLRGYGNAINAEAAQAFIESVK